LIFGFYVDGLGTASMLSAKHVFKSGKKWQKNYLCPGYQSGYDMDFINFDTTK
jgi:hypothetical protein